MRFLVVTPYYRGADTDVKIPDDWNDHCWAALELANVGSVSYVYVDAGIMKNNGNTYAYRGEQDLIQACRAWNIDTVLFHAVNRCEKPPTPDRVALAYISWALNRKIIGVISDLGQHSVYMYDIHYPMIDKIVTWEPFDVRPHTQHPERWIQGWPIFRNDFCNDWMSIEKDIDVSFMGRSYEGRVNMVQDIIDKGIEIFTHRTFYDMKGKSHFMRNEMTYRELTDVHKRSKIMISDSIEGKLKGRAFEAISCGALCLEFSGSSLSDYFEPMKHYIPYINMDDLCMKIEYYKDNESERKEIAEAAYDIWKNNYTGQHMWNRILQEIV